MTKSLFDNFIKLFKSSYQKRADEKLCQFKLTELNNLLSSKDLELEKLHKKLKDKEEDFEKQNKMLFLKEEELMEYINKIFEQQERERIVKWIVDSIREYLDLDKVLSTTVEEIGKLLKVDRCIVTLFNKEMAEFSIFNVYRANEDISPITDKFCILNSSKEWYKKLIEDQETIVINDLKEVITDEYQKIYFEKYDTKSFAVTPIIHKGEILGAISLHQIQYQREWKTSHIEILEDIAGQVAVAIRQASLYTKAQEATRLKSEFLASMSHEFRTPLNAIIGFSEMLMNPNYGSISEKQKEYLNNITISGKHLLRLVNDILDLSKVESGNIELRYEKFSSHKAIEETICMLYALAQEKNISIELNLLEIYMKADIRRFKQIMFNLLSNAIKFTEDGGKINIATTFENGNLKVEVQDSGIGISEYDRDKIFSQFMQIDSSYARKQEGTGLGLTLTKKIIELHKGQIDFESGVGKGSKFWFILPEAELAKI
ncbi:MAG: ATP-binding protein [Candidatus Gastranaerophilales bacterium]|nr:ATP-binding protein [Candidatus Gastranaerophilales bacterium]